jgi:hypothetical protein
MLAALLVLVPCGSSAVLAAPDPGAGSGDTTMTTMSSIMLGPLGIFESPNVGEPDLAPAVGILRTSRMYLLASRTKR